MIRLCNVSFGYDRNIFSGVSYDFEPGIFYILQGENGVGKTTLARIVLGLLKPDSGEVKRPKGCIMSYLPDSNGIYPELTIWQNLRFRLGLYGADRCKSDAHWHCWRVSVWQSTRMNGLLRSRSVCKRSAPSSARAPYRQIFWCWTSRLTRSTERPGRLFMSSSPDLRPAAGQSCVYPTALRGPQAAV